MISGERKGYKLTASKGSTVRPTEDRVKESFFNIISPIKRNSIVLDLFAGTGAIGIEFLSRGAKFAYFIDKNRDSISVINRNLEHTKYNEKSKVITGDSSVVLHRLSVSGAKFDYIYIDPPFSDEEILYKVISIIDGNELLSDDGLLIAEHDEKIAINDQYSSFELFDKRKYGNKVMTYFKRRGV